MPSHIPPHNSLSIRLFRVPFSLYLLVVACARLFYRLPTYLSAWPIRRLFIVSFLRARNAWGAFQTRHYIGPTTGECVESWVRQNKCGYSKEIVPVQGNGETYPDVTLHRLDFGQARNGMVLVYIHGGGFVRPIIPRGHLPLVRQLCRSLKSSTGFVVEYDLAPREKYPTQHVQVVTALRKILEHTPADEIVIAGDSAGACLAASILAHLQTPSPYTAALHLNSNLAGCILICPYVRFRRQGEPLPASLKTNSVHDYVWHSSDLRFQQAYNPKEGEVWAEPFTPAAPPGFWKDLKCEKVLVIAGEWEVLRDDIISFGEKMRDEAKEGKVDLVVSEKSVHVECALDLAVGIENGNMVKELKNWCQILASGQ